MPNRDPDQFTLEKLKINDRLESIEAYIKDGKQLRVQLNDTMTQINLRCTNLELIVHGDPVSDSKYVRDGINRRLETMELSAEEVKKEAKKVKDSFLNIAIGSITLAIGAFMVWLFKLVASTIGKH